MRYEHHDLDGCGPVRTQVYDLPPGPPMMIHQHGQAVPDPVRREYWPAVTDVPCPASRCDGTIRWAEAGYVPGYRICDACGRHYMAAGTAEAPTLLRVGSRRSPR